MIQIKSKSEIDLMVRGGKILKDAFSCVEKNIRPGVKTSQLNEIFEEYLKKKGAKSSFKQVKNYKWSTCMCINEQIVHTPPSDKILTEGDIITIDGGVYLGGYHTDKARTYAVGTVSSEIQKFLSIGRQTLKRAIQIIKPEGYLNDISHVIENGIYKQGYFVIKELTGHGIGKQLHEDPYIPGIVIGNRENSLKLEKGMTLAIEVIYSMGSETFVREDSEKWSLVTSDKSLSACFEDTIAITYKKGALILT